jgi:hypothetical protein
MKIIISFFIILNFLNAENRTMSEEISNMYLDEDKYEVEKEEEERISQFNELINNEYTKKEQKIMSNLYKMYLEKITEKAEIHNRVSENLYIQFEKILEARNQGGKILIYNSKNEGNDLISGIEYYIDFENEEIYSEKVIEFTNLKNKYTYKIKYNHIFEQITFYKEDKLNITVSKFSLKNNEKISFSKLLQYVKEEETSILKKNEGLN